jgi:hypothetical protein
VIRIDVHHTRGNLINTTRTIFTPVHVWHVYASYGRSPYVTTFHADPTELDRFTAPEKKWSRLHLSAQLSGPWDRLSFSSNTTIEAVCLSQISVDEKATRLTEPISQHAISTFNTYSRGLTHRSLINTGGGYNLRGTGLPHHTFRSFQSTVLHFSPKGPIRSQVINYQHKPLAILRVKHIVAEWPPWLDLYRTYNYA